jgi:choline dehydrogenase-like flavoprotein
MLFAERAMAGGRRVVMIERGRPYTFADRLRRKGHQDSEPFNRTGIRVRHPRREVPSYEYDAVFNLGGSTNHFYGNTPRMHPSHFDLGPFGGMSRRWPIRYQDIEPYYLRAEERLRISGNSERTPFRGRFAYPLPPHPLSPADRACESIFGQAHVMQVPTVRPTRPVDGRPPCCASDTCTLCPIDSKGTALNMVYPSIKERVELLTSHLVTEVHVRGRRVEGLTAIAPGGKTLRIEAREYVIASNGVESCLLLQRSPGVPRHETLGRCYMDHPTFDVAVYGSGLDGRPGYGSSAQTAMITSFFERVSRDLPVSMLGEVRFADPVNGTVREDVVGDVTKLALDHRHSADPSFRGRFEAIWRSTIYLRFLVETQPMMDNVLGVREVTDSGQALPSLSLATPPYFEECVEQVLRRVRSELPRASVRALRRRATAHHWMGATRMADDPREGSVDRHLRYHGLDNLFVLSASTFPSCSSANPTLTLGALALRLGDHLSSS